MYITINNNYAQLLEASGGLCYWKLLLALVHFYMRHQVSSKMSRRPSFLALGGHLVVTPGIIFMLSMVIILHLDHVLQRHYINSTYKKEALSGTDVNINVSPILSLWGQI